VIRLPRRAKPCRQIIDHTSDFIHRANAVMHDPPAAGVGAAEKILKADSNL
jgi:hypothetical protein